MFWRRWSLFTRKRSSKLSDEIRQHIDFEIQSGIDAGLSAEEARFAALRKFGNVLHAEEDSRAVWGWLWAERLWQDIRYAYRGFLRQPGFTAVALLSLLLGIGASTALFSVVYGVVIAPYPYATPNEIWAPAVVPNGEQAKGWRGYTRREFRDMAKMSAFSSVMATSWERVTLSTELDKETVLAILVSGNAFDFLGVKPLLGRTIQLTDVTPEGQPAPVAVLSFQAWQRLFNASPNAIGQKITLNDIPRTVVGVMPPRFGWYTQKDMWLPMGMDWKDETPVAPILRLRPGVTPKEAEHRLQQLNVQFAAQTPAAYPRRAFYTKLLNYMDITVASGEMTSSLWILLAAVGCLLLIACVNVANLQLARTTTRAREIAVRLSVGAARKRLVRQLLTENTVLSCFGGACGLLFAFGATRVISALLPNNSIPGEARIEINQPVLLFSLAVSVLTGIVFGLVPALRCSRPNLVDTLKDGARGSGASLSGRTFRRALVIAEVTLAVVLLATASLSIRSFAQLLAIQPGFQVDRALLMELALPPQQYKTLDARNNFARLVLAQLSSLPGVQSVALGNGGIPFGGPESAYTISGQPPERDKRIAVAVVSSDYLHVLGISLKRGRMLTEREVDTGAPFVLVNETAARLWPGADPVGKTLKLDLFAQGSSGQRLVAPNAPAQFTVVGVFGDTRNAGLREGTQPAALAPFTLLAPPTRLLAIRTAGEPLSVLNSVRNRIRELDSSLPVGEHITFKELLGYETVAPRFVMALFACFAGLGLLLAAAGIFSVISYDVSQRIHEIGIRVALGASRVDIVLQVLSSAYRVTALGIASGLAGSWLVVRIIRSRLFASAPFDLASVLAIAALLSAVALLAAFLPAQRAGRLDPIAAMRHEA